jgi:hypothetical protein
MDKRKRKRRKRLLLRVLQRIKERNVIVGNSDRTDKAVLWIQ